MADYLLSYLGTPSATVTYSIDAADKSEDTAETGTGVTEMHAGTVTSLYGVVVTDPPMGGVVNWYESGVFQTSEAITQDDAAVAGDAMTLTAAYDAAKTAASQASVDAVDTVVDGIAADYAKAGEAAAAVVGLATEANATANKEAVLAAIPDIPPPDDGVAITPATLGTDGSPLGRVMPFGVVTVYLAGVARFQFDADGDGDYSYKLPAGSTWTLKARASGYRTMTTEVTT